MTGLLVVLLVAPIVGAAAAFVLPDLGVRICTATAGLVALGWAVLAAQDDPTAWGDVVADPLLAAAAAATALLVAGTRPHTALSSGAALVALTVLPAAAALDPDRLPDRRLALGVVVVALLAAVRLWSERAPRLGQVLAVLAGVVVATGLVGEDPREAVALAVSGTTVAVVAAAVWGAPGRLLLPAGLLAVSRAASARDAADGTDWTLLVVAALVVVAAVVLRAVRARPVTERLPLAGVVVGAALLAVDVVELQQAGALLGAGAVLALAGRHPVALLALVPGTTAAIEAAGYAEAPEHAAVGVAVLAVLVAASTGTLGPGGDRARPGPLAAVAVAFAVVPLWGWAGVDLDGYRTALAVTAAVALPVLLLGQRAWRERSPLGSIIGRRPHAGSTHGTARLPEPVPEAGQGQAGASAPQLPLAVPPQPVPRRAPLRGEHRGGRLRARPGRRP